MAKRQVIDGDSGESVELDGGSHCFIVRVGDDLFEALIDHQTRLANVVGRDVSRAAAAREALGRALLPQRRRKRIPDGQLGFFDRLCLKDPTIERDARRIALDAEARALRPRGRR